MRCFVMSVTCVYIISVLPKSLISQNCKLSLFNEADGVGHCSRDSIRPIKCRFSRGNGGHIFRCELRIGCQWKSHYVENVCLSSTLDMDILLVVCGVNH